MEYCKYHPDRVAQQYCPQCDHYTCNHCVDEGKFGDNGFCFSCGKATEYAGMPTDTTPFWRRIDKSFRYPLEKSVIAFIAIVSFLSAVASFLPLPLMAGLSLLLTGLMIKYSFNCLSETANGNLEAPDITSAYEGGVVLVFRLFFMMVISIVTVGVIYAKVSTFLGSLLGFFWLAALPAVIITYAMTEDMLASLNPLKLISLIATIGLPYGLILGILMVMVSSVAFLSDLIGYQQSVWVLTLQSLVSNFYTVVMFHLMGYMIYQYQYELGVDTSRYAQPLDIRPEQQRLLARIRTRLKDGFWGSAEQDFEDGIKRFSDDVEFNDAYFKFKLATYALTLKNHQKQIRDTERENRGDGNNSKPKPAIKTPQQKLQHVIDQRLLHLMHSDQRHQLTTDYQLGIQRLPNYVPQQAELRFQLASGFYNSGNPKRAAQLLNGLHKSSPKFRNLIPAYELLEKSLRDIPGMDSKADACRKLTAALKQRQTATL